MTHIIVGLGNPGDKYKETRHNTGRMVLEYIQQKWKFPEWEEGNQFKTIISQDTLLKKKVTLLLPNTYMNKSGESVQKFVTSKKKADMLVVVYDDLDLPLGTFKISFNRGDGGHKGLSSIIKKIGTKGFTRVRVGISPKTKSGKIRKPKGEEAVERFILGKFKPTEQRIFLKVKKKIESALTVLISEGRAKAMNMYN